jgi:hypothetical protein
MEFSIFQKEFNARTECFVGEMMGTVVKIEGKAVKFMGRTCQMMRRIVRFKGRAEKNKGRVVSFNVRTVKFMGRAVN